MKSYADLSESVKEYVTLYARVWIEIFQCVGFPLLFAVTLYARVWIEISTSSSFFIEILSPSTRGCGLKCTELRIRVGRHDVTLYARVWIEIHMISDMADASSSHPLREGVD